MDPSSFSGSFDITPRTAAGTLPPARLGESKDKQRKAGPQHWDSPGLQAAHPWTSCLVRPSPNYLKQLNNGFLLLRAKTILT